MRYLLMPKKTEKKPSPSKDVSQTALSVVLQATGLPSLASKNVKLEWVEIRGTRVKVQRQAKTQLLFIDLDGRATQGASANELLSKLAARYGSGNVRAI